jgi:hypothetical protein
VSWGTVLVRRTESLEGHLLSVKQKFINFMVKSQRCSILGYIGKMICVAAI